MIPFLIIAILFTIAVFMFMQQEQFGSLAKKEMLSIIEKSINYREEKFMNESFTPDLAEGVTYWEVTKNLLFNKNSRLRPINKLPSTKTNLHSLSKEEDMFIWFGH